MSIEQLFTDKTIKAKAKVAQIGDWLLDGSLPVDEWQAYTEKQKDSNKATCIEAMEYATRKNPKLADEIIFDFVTQTLTADEPRIKWESAKVIGNTVHQFPAKLDTAIENLLANSTHSGTVVRWATAIALGEILKLKTAHNTKLMPLLESFAENEQDNGVKKKYLDALKKAKK